MRPQANGYFVCIEQGERGGFVATENSFSILARGLFKHCG
jgi:hypothetical protein